MDANSEDNATSVHSQTNYIWKKEVHVMEKRSSCSGSSIGIHNSTSDQLNSTSDLVKYQEILPNKDPYTRACIHYSESCHTEKGVHKSVRYEQLRKVQAL